MNPLETVLRPVTSLLNRNIAESTPARELCARLDGKLIAVRVQHSGLAMYFDIDDGVVALRTEADAEPDAVICAPLLTLARMASSGGTAELRDGSVDFTGDARTAAAFQSLLDYAKPDLEEELSTVVGDIAAHRLGEFARGLRSWSRQAGDTMSENIREYLQEESRRAPSRYEVERFGRQVQVLRDDVARAEARLKQLENRD
jgi:ubiquinone biosynthesis protein UbiJ